MDNLTVFAFVLIIGFLSPQVYSQIDQTVCTAGGAECAALPNSICDQFNTLKCVCSTAQRYQAKPDNSGCDYNCGALTNPTNGAVSTTGTLQTSVATYTCSAGFMLTGASTRTCVLGSGWSGVAPTCVADCGAVPVIAGVTVTQPATTLVGATTTYTCDAPLIGTGNIECQATGWTTPAPCDCGAVPVIAGVTVTPPATTLVGATTPYTCNTPLTGTGNIECQATGWTTPAPCDCGAVPVIAGVTVTQPATTLVGATTPYACNTPLTGTGNIACQATGWTTPAPCDCGAVPVIAGVTVTQPATTLVGATTPYACNTPLTGTGNIACQATGWTTPAPCDCGAVPVIAGLTVTQPATTLVGATTPYACNTPLTGTGNIACQPTGWTTPAPCECPVLTAPEYGAVDKNSTTTPIGGKATYTCNPNLVINGVDKPSCTANGWNSTKPTCECPMLTSPEYGAVDKVSTTTPIGGVATYTCNPNLVINGVDTPSCTDNGWNSTKPTCECPVLTAPEHGSVDKISITTAVGGQATYTCNPNLVINGVDKPSCTANGWNSTKPTCGCEILPDINGGSSGKASTLITPVGDSTMFRCNSGLDRVGHETLTCQATAGWGMLPECKCQALGNPENGYITLTEVDGKVAINTKATYSCRSGFTRVGNEERTCTAVSGWSGSAPVCHCQELTISNGYITSATILATFPAPIGTTVAYTCDTQYKLTGGTTSRTCRNETGWDGKAPTCVEDCGNLTAPINGRVSYTNTILNSTATFDCISEHYKMVGSPTLICQTGPRWNDTEPNCVGDCGDLARPTNGDVSYTDTIVNSKAVYTCTGGFRLSGSVERICDRSSKPAKWTSSMPTCEPGKLKDDCSVNTNLCVKISDAACSNGICTCLAGYKTDGSDLHCEVIDVCEGVTCMNGAKCMGATGGYKCVCPIGYTGPLCETDIDECNPNPCINGSCAETRLGDFTCTCKVGYTGNTCDEEINECIPDPCEHGTCKDLLADYECACQVGYTGKDCSEDIDECFSSPCEHGTCVNLVNSYKCRCDVGYSGANCNQDINDCVHHLCSNGAICIDQVGDYTCKCTAGFSGKYCDDNCPEPVVPENGLLNTSEGLGVGNTIYYSCKDGYELVGKAQRTCGTTSTWSGTEPTCLIQCPILEPITNGDVDMSLGRHEGSQATYFCENNYALIGYPVMTCESSGVWGGKKPGCVFAMFPDTLLAFGVVLIILAIVDVFVLAICVYYKFCRKKQPQTPSKPFPDDLFADGERAVPPRDSTMPPFSRKQKFSKVTPDDDHPPPQSVDEPNVVYRSTMKMNDKVLDTIFSKGSKYRRQVEAEERTPYLDDDVINDKGYNTENSNSNEDAHSEVFDKHLDLTHPSPGPQKSPREKRKQEEPEEEEEEDEGRFRFRLRGPPPSITDSLFKEKETSLTAEEKRRSKSALPSYRLQQKNVLK